MVKRRIKKAKNRIDNFDARLFGSLAKARRPLSIKRLANRTDMSWQTANKHLKKLKEFKVVKFDKTIRKTRVSLEDPWIKKIRRIA